MLFAVFFASSALTELYRRRALALMILDVPNARSSHSVATPRGGGVAIVLSTLTALLILGETRSLSWSSVSGICVGGGWVSLIGFVDDRRHIAARWRLIGHFVAAVWILAMLNGAPRVTMWGYALSCGWLGSIVAAFYIVWMINLTNFMDGIDGIASVETITVCLGAAMLSAVVAPRELLWIAPLILAAATLGFLVWNWPPAKIFMGDSGSGFLGFALAAFALQSGAAESRLFWSWTILLGVFIVDATVTLIRRVANGNKFYEAHRSHAFQLAALHQGSHRPVTIGVAVINLCWLLPIASVVAIGWLDGATAVGISYAPLVVGAVKLNAGKERI